MALSAWCGLVAGLLEVATYVVRKAAFDTNRLYGMTRHFVWLIPLVDLGLFLAVGAVLAIIIWFRPRRGAWLAARLLFAMTLLPSAMVAFPTIYGPASLLVMLGAAARLVPTLERRGSGVRRTVRLSFPLIAGLAPAMAIGLWASDRAREAHERSRPVPPPGAPNVLLVVLDTVAAGHLELYGYGRPTSPTFDELARSGICFDAARSASSWTLPSHATMFTGRWPHELSVGWNTPLDRAYPTLAEYLASHGYATAGFAANTLYCATDSGLARGFTTYRDYIFPRLTALKPAVLVSRSVEGLHAIAQHLATDWDIDISWSPVQQLWLDLNLDRKDAATVHGEFFDWLSNRDQSERPFFAFLNDFDAHWPYQLPKLSIHRFGVPPRDAAESDLIQTWSMVDKRRLTEQQIALARDAYDDCVTHLDEQLGCLTDELARRGLRERTWVIVVADHGESFGEHDGVFCHGTSLYRTELHVPMLILPPASDGALAGLRVAETVSLRDMAATIADLAGLGAGSPFPGRSLSRFWERATPGPNPTASPGTDDRVLSEVVPDDPSNHDPSRKREPRWPLAALSDGDWTYIRREGDAREELFHVPDDPLEARNRAHDPAARDLLADLRQALGRLTVGPLTPERFNP